MLAAVPRLRAFAISLSGKVDRADDLVQETLLLAMANIHSFQPGTNMPAWLLTILRNRYRTEYRKYRREIEDVDGRYAESLISPPEQHSRVEFEEFRVALAKLPPDQREALLLVGASGFSYEEAAATCRLRGGDGQEPGQPGTHAARGAALHRQRSRARSGPRDARCFGRGRARLIGSSTLFHPGVGCTKQARNGVSYFAQTPREKKVQPDNKSNAIAKRSVSIQLAEPEPI